MTLLCYYAVFALERRFEIIFHIPPLFYENMLGYTCLFQLIYVMIIYFLFIFGKVKWLLLLLLTFKVLFGQSFRKTAGYSEHIMFANKYRRRLLFINPFNGPFVEFFFQLCDILILITPSSKRDYQLGKRIIYSKSLITLRAQQTFRYISIKQVFFNCLEIAIESSLLAICFLLLQISKSNNSGTFGKNTIVE